MTQTWRKFAVLFVNQVRYKLKYEPEWSEWEDACHGHRTLEGAIECQERAIGRVARQNSPEDTLILQIARLTHAGIEGRIVKKSAQITTEVIEASYELLNTKHGPQDEPEVRQTLDTRHRTPDTGKGATDGKKG